MPIGFNINVLTLTGSFSGSSGLQERLEGGLEIGVLI